MRAYFIWGPYLLLLVAALLEFRRGVRRAHAVWLIWLLFCFSKFLFFERVGGHAFSPDLPEWLIWFWDCAYSGAMIYCVLAVLVAPLAFRRKRAVVSALAWSASLWGLFNGLCVPSVHEVKLAFADLPPELDGYRLVHLSDLHCSCSARRGRTQAIVDRVNALKPDLICLTGDYADGLSERVGAFVEPLGELRATDGVLACTGNHEYYHDFGRWCERVYGRMDGVRFLSNDCVFPRSRLVVGGVPDVTGCALGMDDVPDPRLAFAAATNGEFRVLLQHRPKGAEENCREVGVRLQLSGHTHGGIAPGFRPLIGRFNGGFVRGDYRLGDAYLLVSPGVGQWSGFPMRFFNPSEIVLITFRREDSGPPDP